MKTQKIKLAYPTYRYNRLKNVIKGGAIISGISSLIRIQIDKHNNYNQSAVRDDVLNPGPWTLHFDGKDFWFEATEQTILNSSLWEDEVKE